MKKLTGLTVVQVVAKLNESVQHFVGTKLGDIHCSDTGVLHGSIGDVIAREFAEDGLQYHTWYVIGKPAGLDYTYFRLHMDKFKIAGFDEVLSLRFEPVLCEMVQDYPNISFELYAGYVKNEVGLVALYQQDLILEETARAYEQKRVELRREIEKNEKKCKSEKV